MLYWGLAGHGSPGLGWQGGIAWQGAELPLLVQGGNTILQGVTYRCSLFLFSAGLIKFIFKGLLILIVLTVFGHLQNKCTPHRLKTDASEDKAGLKAYIITLNII